MTGTPPSITCPACHAVSHNKGDIEQRYCGRCHSYHEDLAQGAAPAAAPATEDTAQGAAPTAQSFFVRTVPHAPPRFWPGARKGPSFVGTGIAWSSSGEALVVLHGELLGLGEYRQGDSVTPGAGCGIHLQIGTRQVVVPMSREQLQALDLGVDQRVELLIRAEDGPAPAAPPASEAQGAAPRPRLRPAVSVRVGQVTCTVGEPPAEGSAAPAVQQPALDLEVVEDECPPRHQRTPAQWLAGHDTTEACLRLGVTPPSPCLCDPCRYARRVLELEGAAPAAPRAPEEPAQGAAPAAAVRLTVDVTDPSAPVVHSSWPLDLSREQLAAARATVRSVSKTLLERLKEQHPTAAAGESTPALATTPSSGPSPAAEEP